MGDMDEELIPALNEADLQWIRDRDERPMENPAGVFGETEGPRGGGILAGAMSPLLAGETTPPALRERGFLLRGQSVHAPIHVGCDEQESVCEREGDGIADTVMENQNQSQHLSEAETVPALPVGVLSTPPRRPTAVARTPEKVPDPKKKARTVAHEPGREGGPPCFGGGGATPKLVPPLFAGMQPPPPPEGGPPGPTMYDLTRGDQDLPWVQELQQGMRAMLGSQRSLRQELQGFASVLNQHEGQISRLTKAHQDNAMLHENTQRRLKALESEVTELRRTSRSPTPSVRGGPGYGPDRSPPGTPRGEVSLADELSIVIGGWSDARRPEIEQEVREFLQRAAVEFTDIIVPYARSNFCRVLPVVDVNVHFADSRRAQQATIATLKAMAPESKILGSEGGKLWITAHRSPEERARIRAVVSATAFCEELSGLMTNPLPVDKEWRGRVFLGPHLVLGHQRNRPQQTGDVALLDSRGNETGWVLISRALERAAGIPVADLQERWLAHLQGR